MRRAKATSVNKSNTMIAIGRKKRSLGLKKKGGVTEFAVVVTDTVTFSATLELTTYVFRGSFVLIAQLAFGALVLQEK
jgi:hypothetical protein